MSDKTDAKLFAIESFDIIKAEQEDYLSPHDWLRLNQLRSGFLSFFKHLNIDTFKEIYDAYAYDAYENELTLYLNSQTYDVEIIITLGNIIVAKTESYQIDSNKNPDLEMRSILDSLDLNRSKFNPTVIENKEYKENE